MEEILEQAKFYFTLPDKTPLENPNNLIFINEILINKNEFKVFFKNKTLMHFIERRRTDLSKRNTSEKSLEIILKMLVDISEVLTSYTICLPHPEHRNRYIVQKEFTDILKTSLTAVLEIEDDGQIIVSYFFTKK